MIVRRIFWPTLFSVACVFFPSLVVGQEFPTKPIRIVIANPNGSLPDIITRLIIPEMSKSLGQAVVVEPKPGGDQRIGAEYVAKQVPADGYTIAVLSVANLATIPALVKDPRFDPQKDLPPITTMATARIVLGTPANSPWKTLNELVEHAKANPGKLNYGSTAVGTRLRIEAILQSRAIDIVHIPYPNSGPMNQALFAGQIQLIITNEGILSDKERIRGLAVSGERRSTKYPDIPTYIELGLPPVPGADYSLNAPLGTPKLILDRLYGAVSRSLQQPELKVHLEKVGLEVVNDSSEAAAKNIAGQIKLVSEIAKKLGLQPQ